MAAHSKEAAQHTTLTALVIPLWIAFICSLIPELASIAFLLCPRLLVHTCSGRLANARTQLPIAGKMPAFFLVQFSPHVSPCRCYSSLVPLSFPFCTCISYSSVNASYFFRYRCFATTMLKAARSQDADVRVLQNHSTTRSLLSLASSSIAHSFVWVTASAIHLCR